MATNPFDRITGNGQNTISAAGGGMSSRRPRRPRRPSRPARAGQLTGGGGEDTKEPENPFVDSPFDPNALSGTGNPAGSYLGANQSYGSDYLDTGKGSAAFNDMETRNNAVRGFMSRAGADFSSGGIGGMGQAQWMQQQVQDLSDAYDDFSKTNNTTAGGMSLENFLYGTLGGGTLDSIAGNNAAPAAGTGVQINQEGAISPAADMNAFLQAQGISQRQWRDMRPDRRERLRSQFTASQTSQSPVVPAGQRYINEAERQAVVYPAALNTWRRRWEHAMPSDRGTEQTRWTGANSTVAY